MAILTSPLINLKGFATSRPPLVIFTLCIIAFGVTTFCLAYIIGHSDSLPNPDNKSDWKTFLKHLSSIDLCILTDDITPNKPIMNVNRSSDDSDEVNGNVSISVTASLSLIHQLVNLPPNVTVLSGAISIDNWDGSCLDPVPVASHILNLSIAVPQNISSQEVCVVVSGPRGLLPPTNRGVPLSCPNVIQSSEHGLTARLVARERGDYEDEWCPNGAVVKMEYRQNPQLIVTLTVQDRSLMNLHLVHTSYFLFVMAMTLICYALIKGKPKQKTIMLEKVPLDPL